MNTFFTSDTHFGHTNIAGKSISKWKDGYRNYNSLEEMNQDLVKSINSLVKEDDTLYHLGDWSFGGIENIWKFRKQILCKNIHLILGNHDHHIESKKILPNVYQSDIDNKYYDGTPDCLYARLEVWPVELFSSISHYKEIRINDKVFILSHYPLAVWHGNGKGWYHLHGHCHGSFNSIGKSMDVGVDNTLSMFKTPRPFTYDEVIDILDKKDLQLLDHHNSNTNTGKRPR